MKLPLPPQNCKSPTLSDWLSNASSGKNTVYLAVGSGKFLRSQMSSAGCVTCKCWRCSCGRRIKLLRSSLNMTMTTYSTTCCKNRKSKLSKKRKSMGTPSFQALSQIGSPKRWWKSLSWWRTCPWWTLLVRSSRSYFPLKLKLLA
jgi:hypothetical protein